MFHRLHLGHEVRELAQRVGGVASGHRDVDACPPLAISSRLFCHACCAACLSRLRSSLSHVKPSPITRKVSCGKVAANSRSPVFHLPLMNCTTATRSPRPSARNTSPSAAVVLP